MIRLLFALVLILLSVSNGSSQLYGDPIVTWDFANGIPSDWEEGISSTNNIAHWEYRGPETTPGVNIGARGSCSAIASPITSLTQANGFVVFDGNFWDDPGSACGIGFGTGPDPAPHTSWLITNSVDLTAVNSAVLTFQQQYRHFQTNTTVHISTDEGATWIQIHENTGIQSPNAEWVSVNISQWAANQPSVRLKFQYEGIYYWWLLDDINIYIPNDNDILITKAQYTNNQIVDGIPTLYDLEYSQYPLLMLPALSMKAQVLNVGGYQQTGVQLNARVIKDSTAEVFNETSEPISIDPSASAELSFATPFSPTTGVGYYEVLYSVLQDSLDDTPQNNIDSLDFSITSFTYGKDDGPMEDSYNPQPFYDTYQTMYGNFYENTIGLNRYCHTIQAAIAEGTAVGKEIRGVVYNQELDSIIGYTQSYQVNYGDLNEPGEERLVYLDFDAPLLLKPDSIYFMAVEELDSIQPFYVARSGSSFGESSLIRYQNINASIISTKSFVVRLTILSQPQRPGCTDVVALNYQANALIDDGSCDYPGCTNEDADNFNPEINFDDGSCIVAGCTDTLAYNYNPFATYQGITCIYRGCMAVNALNFDPQANEDDGTCEYLTAQIFSPILSGCPPFDLNIENNNEFLVNAQCSYTIDGIEVFNVCSSEFDFVFEEPGIHEVTYSITVGNSFADTTLQVEVFAPSAQPEVFYDALNHELICTNCFDNSLTWFFDGTIVNNGNSTAYDAEVDGITQNGNYQLMTTNLAGCETLSDTIAVCQPHLAASATGGCAPITIYFNNLTDTISGLVCSLQTGLSLVEDFSSQQEVSYTTAGIYNVTISCSTALASGEYTITIEASDVQTPQLEVDDINGVVICTNASAFTEFVWNIDGDIIEGGSSQALGGDVYQLQAYNADGCGGANLLIVNDISEISNMGIQAYPNPAHEAIQILSEAAGAVTIFNSAGLIVFESRNFTSQQKIATHNWPAGLYFARWKDDVKTEIIKFEITH
jgi:hypothetical protein